MKLAAAAEQFQQELAGSRSGSAHTRTAMARDVTRLVELAGDVALAEVKPAHIRSCIAAEHRRGLAVASLKRMLSSWRKFFEGFARQQLLPSNPARDVWAPRSGKPLPKVLTPDEVAALLDKAAAAGGELGVRDAAMFELAYSSALRVSELVGIDVEDVDVRQQLVRVRHGKGGRQRLVPVGAAALAALGKWQPLRTLWCGRAAGGGALFINRRGGRLSVRTAQYRIVALAAAAGLPAKVSPHILRHSCASHLLQSSGDLRAVQEFLGHADVSSTQVYTHLDFQALAAVYDRTHPRAGRRSAGDGDN
ncbi:MAG: tyrosine-type recombinase/integrase [Betaproteobacteria bacterium]|nr:tyrosine-type recombinase/integrase [Betaproteobacteria bacterium]